MFLSDRTYCLAYARIQDQRDNETVQSLDIVISFFHRSIGEITAHYDLTEMIRISMGNSSVKVNDLRENQNEDHRHKDLRFVQVCSDTLQ
jgi:cupin superfamily acireductone dioxygenase involved in methionine salvage